MKQTIKLISLLLLAQTCGAQTIIGGVFFSDTVISVANSPYHVTSNVLIPIGVKVTIEPGVVLAFDADIGFQVEGELQAKGTPTDSIIFKLQSGSTEWDGFNFSNSAVPYNQSNGSGCIFDYCVFSNADYAIWINEASVRVLNSEIRNGGGGIVAYGSDILIQNTRVHDCIYQAITTFYGFIFPAPVIIDHCEIYNISGNNDAIRLTANAQLINSNIHHCSSPNGALSVWGGPSIVVGCNNFHDNTTKAVLMVSSSYGTVQLTDNSFTNNKINLATSSCYKTPIITHNNFYSYTDYNVYCTDHFGLTDNDCDPIPGSSYFTLDMQQNYFAHTSTAQLDSSIYDLYDNWIGRTIVAYDTSITTSYTNSSGCSSIFNSAATTSDPINFLSVFPNPTNGQLNVQLMENINDKVDLNIYNAIGANVYQQYSDNQSLIKLNLIDFKSGLYYLVVEAGTFRTTKKFCIM